MQNTLDRLRNLKSGATLFGKFYPTDYIVAIFNCSDSCQRALAGLRQAGWLEEDLLVSDGDLIQAHQAEVLENRSFLDKFCSMLADEDTFANAAHRLSRRENYRFLLIYAPTPELTAQAREVIAPEAVYAQKYEKLRFSEIEVHGKENS